MSKTPIIIDCDPGVDDSYAVALANYYDGFEIKAITPVEGNVVAASTRRNALGLREILGIDCRVAFGADRPLVRPYVREASGTHGSTGVGSVVLPEPTRGPDEKEAWDVIYEEAVKSEGKLILFAVGPLTNVAIALQKYPDLPKYVDKCVVMGGGTYGNIIETAKTAEFNIWVDPQAARIVFEAFDVYMVGCNACFLAPISGEDFDDMIRLCGDGEKAYLVRELSRFSKENAYKSGHDNNIIYDAITVASMIDPEIVKYEDYYVYVEDTRGVVTEGQTVIDLAGRSGKKPNCHVAMDVDVPKWVALLKDMCRYYGSLS